MSTTQSKIAEQVLRRLRKYSQDSDIDERDVMIAIHQSLGTIIRNRFYETKNSESQEVDGSIYYNVRKNLVKKNDSDEFYIDMPSTTIELPFGVDIKRCGTPKGKGFIPTQNGISDLYDGLESGELEGQIGFYKSGATIVFHNMDASNKPKTVDLRLALPFDSLDEDDPINLPQDMLDQAIEMVLQKFGVTLQVPADITSNSIDNP